jgi:hypothetical protein
VLLGVKTITSTSTFAPDQYNISLSPCNTFNDANRLGLLWLYQSDLYKFSKTLIRLLNNARKSVFLLGNNRLFQGVDFIDLFHEVVHGFTHELAFHGFHGNSWCSWWFMKQLHEISLTSWTVSYNRGYHEITMKFSKKKTHHDGMMVSLFLEF